MKTKKANLTIIGYGAIGKGFSEVLLRKQAYLKKNYGIELCVKAVCEINGSLVNDEGVDLRKALELAKTKNLQKHPDWTNMKAKEAIKNVPSDIVLELTPSDIKTGQPGLAHMEAALSSGRHVVTSNKAPLAVKFSHLQALAEENKVRLMYEATVCGALPIINLRRHTLQINEIKSIQGILNGTSNFVLTKMAAEGVTMDVALKEARELGIAEADPSYDIRGIDSGAKLVILANSLMNMDISYADIDVTGIEGVTTDAIELARKNNQVIKLIGDVGGKEVSPRLVPKNHPLNVSGTLNAVMINTDIAENITVVGRGAGGTETASSLFADVIELLA
jgi:homoserine dehydrogenase